MLLPINLFDIGEIDSAIIAGMGGLLIRDIIIESKEVIDSLNYFIVQPQNAQKELRMWFEENGYTIISESLAFESNKIYEIIKVKKGNMIIENDINYEIGVNMENISKNEYEVFINKKIKKYLRIKENILSNANNIDVIKINEANDKIIKLEEVLLCL